MTKPYRVHRKYYAPLELVATVGTVAELWGRSYTGVLYAIDTENIAALKCGKTWLVSLPSVAAYWGTPPCPLGGSNSEKVAVSALHKKGKYGHRTGYNSGEVGGVERALHELRGNILGEKEQR